MAIKRKGFGITFKFLLQNIGVSILLGIVIWNVFSSIFSEELRKIIDSITHEKITVIEELGKQYQTSLKQYQNFQRQGIEKILNSSAQDFYLMVQFFYQEVQKKKITLPKAQEELKKLMAQKKVGQSGYFYILNSKGDVLYHPQKTIEKTNQNLPGRKYDFIRFQIENTKQEGQQAFTSYEWKNPNDNYLKSKVLSQIYFKPWDWIISLTAYQAEFDFILDHAYEKSLFAQLKKQILNLKLGKSGYPFVVSNQDRVFKDHNGKIIKTIKKGEILIHPDKNMEGILISQLDGNIIKQKENLDSFIQKPKGFWEYQYKGQEKFASFRHFNEMGWVILISGQKNEFFSENRQVFLNLGFKIIILFLALNILFNFAFFYFSVIRVMKKVSNKLDQVASGNLNIPRDELKTKDSIGKMFSSINNMINNLENIISNILGSTADISKSMEDVSEGNRELSDRTEKQAVALEELGASIEEFASIVKSNSDHTDRASKLSQEAKLSAEHGGEVVYEAVNTMKHVQESSYEIENIINMIEEIAFQTNLLALNASVEAARAGEHGRGFAVVALEIRNLAKNTSIFAKKVYELIKSTLVKIEHGNDLVNKSGVALQEIIDLVTEAHTLITEVNIGSLEQKNGIEEINKAIIQLQEINDHNSQMAEITSSSSQGMVTKMLMLRAIVKFFIVKKEILEKTRVERKSIQHVIKHYNKDKENKEETNNQEKSTNLEKMAKEKAKLEEGKAKGIGSKLTKVFDTEESLSLKSGEFEEF